MVAAKYGAYPGALRDSIRTSSKSKNGVVNVNVIAGNYKAFYANMVEFGTKAHEEKPAGAKSLFVAGMFKMQINHPGAESKSFMRPAFDTKSGDAMQAAATYMTDRLDKELEKQG